MRLTYRENKRPIDENGIEHRLCFGEFSKIHSCEMCAERTECWRYKEELKGGQNEKLIESDKEGCNTEEREDTDFGGVKARKDFE